MVKSGLFSSGALFLAAGIALWVYGYNLEPTVGEAISDAFDKEFTDKRDLLMYSGAGLAIVGFLTMAGGGFFNGRKE